MISIRHIGLTLVSLIILSLTTLALDSCTTTAHDVQSYKNETGVEKNPVNLGQGMLEFDFPEDWPESLTRYMNDHPDMKIVTITNGSSRTGMHSTWTSKMLVVVEPRNPLLAP